MFMYLSSSDDLFGKYVSSDGGDFSKRSIGSHCLALSTPGIRKSSNKQTMAVSKTQ